MNPALLMMAVGDRIPELGMDKIIILMGIMLVLGTILALQEFDVLQAISNKWLYR